MKTENNISDKRGHFIQRLSIDAAQMGVELTAEAAEKLWTFNTELARWNRRVNLVSRQPGDWIQAHFLDSLAPLGAGLVRRGERVIDLGAGAGFPGIPLMVAGEDLFLGMAESSGKKCAWLRHLVRALELKNTRVLEGRFEETVEAGWEGEFQLAVSRAAAKPWKILEWAGPFLAPGGRALVYTTGALVKGGVGKVHPYTVPGSKVPSVIWEVSVAEIR